MILLISIIKPIYGQLLIDTAYCNFDSVNNYYFMKTKVSFSEMNNTNSQVFKINNTVVLTENFVYTDTTGLKYHKFIQTKNNVPILNSEILIREFSDSIVSANGLLNKNIPNLTASYSATSAIQNIVAYTNFYKYKWQDTAAESSIKEELGNPNATNYPNPSLAYYKINKNDFSNPSNYKLIYMINVSALFSATDSSYSDSTYILDATNGQIIKSFSPLVNCFHHTEPKQNKGSLAVCQQNCVSTSPTIHYYGGQTINTEKFLFGATNCTHRLKDNCTGTFLYVKKVGNSGGEKDFRNNANTWAGSGSPSDKVGATALWVIEKSHEFYINWLGRNSFDNNFSQIKAVVFANSAQRTAWNLIDDNMEIGHFNGGQSYETTLDIIGHEITHGVLDKICYMNQDGNIGLIDEEGALGEGYGDIFGQGIEHYVNNNYSTNGLLDDFYHGSNLGAFVVKRQRNIANPKSTNNVDTYGGINWVSNYNGSPSMPDFYHTNSTVLSHWYYLLAQGGSGTNDNSNSYCVKPLGQYKSLQIAYLSLFYLVGTQKKFINARNASIQAANQLYGPNSNEVAQVTAAWYAVGVGPNYSGTIDVKNHTATSVENYQYNNKIEVQNFTANSGSDVTITSNTEIALLPNDDFNQGSIVNLYITPACVGGARLGNTANPRNEGLSSEAARTLSQETKNLNVNESQFSFAVIPNPTNGTFKLQTSNNLEYPKQIIIRDVMGRNVKIIDNPNAYEHEFNLEKESPGIYMINVYYTDKVISKRIIKN